MSTEATGGSQTDAVGASEPNVVVAAEGAEAPATAVAEPAAAETGAVVPTAWDTAAPSAWDVAPSAWESAAPAGRDGSELTVSVSSEAVTVPGHAEATETGDDLVPDEAAETEASAEGSEAGDSGEAGEADDLDEAVDDSDEAEEPEKAEEPDEPSEVYDDYADGEAAEYDEDLEYDEDFGYDEELEHYEGTEDYDEYEAGEVAEPRRARWWTRVLLGLGFLMLGAVIVGGALAIVGTVTHGFKKPVKVVYTKSALFSLKTGDCFDPQGQSYTLVSCDSPHVAEVFATFTLDASKWPGTAAVVREAMGGCTSRLTGYLNPQLAISLSSTYVYPDSIAWREGTRTVVCEVRAASGELTGSVREASATEGTG